MMGVDPQIRRSIARDGGWRVCFAGMDFWGMYPLQMMKSKSMAISVIAFGVKIHVILIV